MSKDRNIGEKRAREARTALGLDPLAPIPCVFSALEAGGLPIILAPLPTGLAGACWPSTDGRRVLWVNARDACVRQRFTLAHEFGHVRCGHTGRLPVETDETLRGGWTSSPEHQANAFASDFLIPRAAVKALGIDEPDLEEVCRLAAAYGTSALAALIRLKTVGCCSEERMTALRAEIDEKAHLEIELEHHEDALSRLAEDDLPHLSAAVRGTALDRALAGDPDTPLRLRAAIDRLLAAEDGDGDEDAAEPAAA